MNDLPKIVKVRRRIDHNDDNVSLILDYRLDFLPGQFLMIWLPGVNEKPFSIAGQDDDGLWLSIRRRGDFSSRLADLQEGGQLGVRGAYGNPFRLVEKCCLVGGGIGLACVAPIADLYPDAPILYGENTATSQIYAERFPKAAFYTMDGTGGRKGFPTDDLESTIRKQGCEMVYGCGPEPMLKAMVTVCQSLDVPCQVSVERYMKCGIGVCGQCVCGKQRVCTDGTIFDGAAIVNNPDFGTRGLGSDGAWRTMC